MKRTLLIIAGIGLLCVLLIVRSFYRQNTRMEDERAWFVRGVRYEFSAEVDSIRMLNENMARLWCRLTLGDPKIEREDSLKQYFQQHDKLYLVFKRSADTITFLVPYGQLVRKGDSVRVSSKANVIYFFRAGEEVVKDDLTNTLTGFGRPFFLKNKK